MNKQEFNRLLYEHDIDRNIYTLGKSPSDCMYTVQIHGDTYEVYYFEHGIKEHTKTFNDKGESLDYLFDLLLADPRASNSFNP